METTQKGRQGWMSWGLVALALSLAAGTVPTGQIMAAGPARGRAGASLVPAARRGVLPTGLAAAVRRVLATPAPGATWSPQAELTARDGAASDVFGSVVALSGDTALVGAWGKNAESGVAYVFVRSGSTWTQQAELTARDATANDHFGSSVALRGDTALVGAPFKNSENGAAYVFVRTGMTWSQQAELTPNGAAYADFGVSVAVSGTTALVGAPAGASSGSGAVYVFGRRGSTWSQQAELTARDGTFNDDFGSSVALSQDTALVGALGKNGYTGAAYVFGRSGTSWSQQAELSASDGAADDYFGTPVALSGNTALVGAFGKNRQTGAAYVFVRSGRMWSQQTELTANDGAAGDQFGTSVALHRDTALVGAPYRNGASGAVYVFGRRGSTWSPRAELTAPNGAASNAFGYVALSESTVLVGAPGTYNQAGAAYVFARHAAMGPTEDTQTD